MDAYPVAKLAEQTNPILEKWFTPGHKNSVIALRDLAEATRKVLHERETHYCAEYPLCSSIPITEAEIVRIIGERIGKSIEIKTPTFEAGVNRLARQLFGGSETDVPGFGLASAGDMRGDLVADTLERLILFYSRRGLTGNPNVLRWLLGREPTTVAEWVESVAPK